MSNPIDHIPKDKWIKKGETRNPQGSSKKARVLNAIRTMTYEEVKDVMVFLLTSNLPSVEKIAESDSESALKVWIAAVAVKAIKKGDVSSLEVLLNRVIGKPAQVVDMKVDGNVSHWTPERAREIAEEYLKNGRGHTTSEE